MPFRAERTHQLQKIRSKAAVLSIISTYTASKQRKTTLKPQIKKFTKSKESIRKRSAENRKKFPSLYIRMRSIVLIYEIKQGKTKTKEEEKEDLQNLHESANLNQEKDRKRCNFTHQMVKSSTENP